MKILVTGGAGFIGSYIVDALIKKGHKVRIFDNLDPQVHGREGKMPDYLNLGAEFVKDDIRNRDALRKAIEGVEIIFHEASAVGVGQSMYQICKYVETNSLGTANLLDILVNETNGVEKIILASSMSNYGEGKYECVDCGVVFPKLRSDLQLRRHDWEVKCPNCGRKVKPLLTDEEKPLFPSSIYAITKRDQEEMFLEIGQAYQIPVVILRYFNTYGPRQALSNPYTGVAAIFSTRIINRDSPIVFEDGLQSRDFIHVNDVVQANILALEKEEANYEIFNVGTGMQTNLLELINFLAENLLPGEEVKPDIVNKFREGDIRHCFADISKIEKKLGFKPRVRLKDGIVDLINWVKRQSPEDNVVTAKMELDKRGLTK
jgi:dTDP-L-rhamnose 4-epimerase